MPRLAEQLAASTVQMTESKMREDLDGIKAYVADLRQWANRQVLPFHLPLLVSHDMPMIL